MELFVTETVFNKALFGKAVRIKGHDFEGDKWDGLYIISDVKFDTVVLVGRSSQIFHLHMENFGEDLLTLTVLEEAE